MKVTMVKSGLQELTTQEYDHIHYNVIDKC